jgi:hypothetical protein
MIYHIPNTKRAAGRLSSFRLPRCGMSNYFERTSTNFYFLARCGACMIDFIIAYILRVLPAFASGHSFLVVTVSSVGAPLLLFALYEGIKYGSEKEYL